MIIIYFTTSSSRPDINAHIENDGKPITVEIQNYSKDSLRINCGGNNNGDASYISNGPNHRSVIKRKSNGMCTK